MPDERGRLSRRGLFGALGRGMRELTDSLKEGTGDVRRAGARPNPGAAPPGTPPPRPDNLPRILRPDHETAPGRPDGFDAWRTDRAAGSIDVGASLTLRGDELPEPLVIVRVNDVHWTATSGECPADGSELLWDGPGDRLHCPACRSRWRLDGEPMAGPANAVLDVLFVEREPDGMRLSRP